MFGSFRKALQDQVISICTAAVGTGTDATDFVNTFDSFLHDLPQEDFPYIVVNCRQADQVSPGEMGTSSELFQWNIHIYYLDIDLEYHAGEVKRDNIIDRLITAFELNPRLSGLSKNNRTVYDSNFTSILFDSSGQDGYYSFISELYLSVDTSKI